MTDWFTGSAANTSRNEAANTGQRSCKGALPQASKTRGSSHHKASTVTVVTSRRRGLVAKYCILRELVLATGSTEAVAFPSLCPNSCFRAAGMARKVYPRIRVQFLPPTWWFTTICGSSSRRPDTLFCPVCVVHRHDIHAGKTLIHTKNKASEKIASWVMSKPKGVWLTPGVTCG